MGLPVKFIELLEENLEDQEVQALTESLKTPKIESIRYNTNKKCPETFGIPIPWCKEGYYLKERPSFTLDPNFHSGSYYVQEASSMFLAHVVNDLCQNINVEYALDLCAAPGGKSTLLLDNIPADACLFANEVIQHRAKILKENIVKWGRNNCIVTNNDPQDFEAFAGIFDLVVVDAPCSGEGMFRKDPKAIDEWSIENVNLCHSRQQRILSNAEEMLASQGHMIYSTCTYNNSENINNVEWLLKSNNNLECVEIPFEKEWGITTIRKNGAIGYQFYPHKTKGEGFFISVVKNNAKNESYIGKSKALLVDLSKDESQIAALWVNQKSGQMLSNKHGDIYLYNEATYSIINFALSNLKVVYSGVKCGNLQKKIFKPDHALALSSYVEKGINRVELLKQEALSYLNKTLSKFKDAQRGWILVTYDGKGIGWAKNIGNRINNYLPVGLRIKMKID